MSRSGWWRRAVLLAAFALCGSVLPANSASTPHVVVDGGLTRLFDTYARGARGDRWTGSDSAITIPLPDGRVLWTGGDTFLGEVNKDGSRAPQGFIHNCYVVQNRNGSLGPTLFTRALGRPDEAKIRTGDLASWYWLLDGFVEGGRLRQFVIRITGTLAAFSIVSTEIASLTLPRLDVEGVGLSPAPYAPVAGGGAVYYGVAVVPDRAWTYIYGLESFGINKYLHVARARTGRVMQGDWQYWDGSEWGSVAALSARLFDGAGDEMSVVRTKSGFRAVASTASIGSDITMWTAARPEGPWGGKRLLYRTPEANGQTVTYNAKEHPEHAGRDYISVSYNVNVASTNTNGLYSDVRNYQPRFIKVYVPPDL